MSAENWQENNARYLSAALEWLRLRLLRLAKPADASAGKVTHAAEGMSKFETGSPPPMLLLLGKQLGLSKFEMEVLLLCSALELDTRVAGLCAQAQDDPNRPYPTFALALALFDDPAWEALSPDRPLRYYRLIEINQPGAQPLTTSAIRADERIVSYIKGLNTLDDRLTNFIYPMDVMLTSDDPLPDSQQKVTDQIVQHWKLAPSNMSLPVAQLLGPDPISKQLVATCAVNELGLQIYKLSAESLPTQFGELETLARLWQRESALLPLALYLDAQEIDGEMMEHGAPLGRFLARADGVVLLGVRENWTRLARTNFPVDIDKPTTAEQETIWSESLGGQTSDIARKLTAQFKLNGTTIAGIAREALSDSNIKDEELGDKLWGICCAKTRPRLDALAQRLDPKATWDDLVLPAEQTALLHQISHQVGQRHRVYEEWGFAEKMNRGLGISALFAGDSGTGKTMAAEVIANELKLNLYRIDLSAVVSKYIGETEKNLRRLFDAAEDGGAILFFDEADALFGKRSEVKDSHDRYANIEINYLLQRMEAYRGLAILATNLKSALDPAFMRRLRFIVNFPFPSPSERKLIWQKVFPLQAPREELDYERLGRFNITGGNIHSIALNAAFAAAQTNSKVTMPIVLSAARTEFHKLNKPISEADLR